MQNKKKKKKDEWVQNDINTIISMAAYEVQLLKHFF